jgi:hypothetical protein
MRDIGGLMREGGEWDQNLAPTVAGFRLVLDALIKGSNVAAQAVMAHIEFNAQNDTLLIPIFKDL